MRRSVEPAGIGGKRIMTYHTISVQTELERRRALAVRNNGARRRATLAALDDMLEQLEQLNLNDRAVVPAELAQQLVRFGISYHPAVGIPDLIELVFSRQEQFMLTAPERGSRVPSVEELEAYFEMKSAPRVA
jgi:hypothetical protein